MESLLEHKLKHIYFFPPYIAGNLPAKALQELDLFSHVPAGDFRSQVCIPCHPCLVCNAQSQLLVLSATILVPPLAPHTLELSGGRTRLTPLALHACQPGFCSSQVLERGCMSVFNPGNQLTFPAAQGTVWIIIRGQVCDSPQQVLVAESTVLLQLSLVSLQRNYTGLGRACLATLRGLRMQRQQKSLQACRASCNQYHCMNVGKICSNAGCADAGVAGTSIKEPAKCCKRWIHAVVLASWSSGCGALATGGSIFCPGVSNTQLNFTGMLWSGWNGVQLVTAMKLSHLANGCTCFCPESTTFHEYL